jgi:hypothetical protein
MTTLSAGTDKTTAPSAHHGEKLEKIFATPWSLPLHGKGVVSGRGETGRFSSIWPVKWPSLTLCGQDAVSRYDRVTMMTTVQGGQPHLAEKAVSPPCAAEFSHIWSRRRRKWHPLARRQRRCSASGRPRRAPGRNRKARQGGMTHSACTPESISRWPCPSRLCACSSPTLRRWIVTRAEIRRQPSLGTQVDRHLLA